jgi:hypothetical protein
VKKFFLTSSNGYHSRKHRGTAPITKINPTKIGWYFVQQYYTFINESPERVHLFYNANSTFVHGTEGENVPVAYGKKVFWSSLVGDQ